MKTRLKGKDATGRIVHSPETGHELVIYPVEIIQNILAITKFIRELELPENIDEQKTPVWYSWEFGELNKKGNDLIAGDYKYLIHYDVEKGEITFRNREKRRCDDIVVPISVLDESNWACKFLRCWQIMSCKG